MKVRRVTRVGKTRMLTTNIHANSKFQVTKNADFECRYISWQLSYQKRNYHKFLTLHCNKNGSWTTFKHAQVYSVTAKELGQDPSRCNYIRRFGLFLIKTLSLNCRPEYFNVDFAVWYNRLSKWSVLTQIIKF